MIDPALLNYWQAYDTGKTTEYEAAMRVGTWDWNKFPDAHPQSSALNVAD